MRTSEETIRARRERAGTTDIVFTFFSDTWADAVQRNLCFTLDRCIVEASRHPDIGRTVVVNAPRSAAGTVVRRLQGHVSPPLPAGVAPLVQPLRLRRHEPTDVPALERHYRAYDRQVERAVRRSVQGRPLVVTASPFVAAFSELSWASSVIYYGYDDWAAHPAFAAWSPAIDHAYTRIARNGRKVAAVSRPILDRIDPSGPAEVIPNGVEPSEWNGSPTAPEWFDRSKAPLLLYVGSIGPRLDLDMVRATAAGHPDTRILIVGPHADDDVVAQLGTIPNVELRGSVGRSEVAALIEAADVCIMPHHATELTVSMSPLKVYEYLAGGAAAVVTDLPPLADVRGRVERVAPGDALGFSDAVTRALRAGRASDGERADFVARNSWSRRFDQLLRLAHGDGPA